jgi:NitT/TauT family transport system substrate-binding protein
MGNIVKKITLLMFIMIALTLFGCNSTKSENKIKVLVPSGIPFVAVGDLIDQKDIVIDSVIGPDLLITGMISKSHDIIIAPLNVGAKLYLNESSNYKLDSTITFGNTYIVSRKSNTLNTIEDLNDKNILAYGKNSIPDILLKKALDSNEIKAEISYQGGIDQVIPFFICNPKYPDDVSCNPPDYILCAEPLITKLELEYNMDLNILDLQAESGSKLIPQAAIFINPESENLKEINIILNLIKANVEYLNNNPKEYANKIVNKHSYFKNLGVKIIESSIPRSNINYLNLSDNIEIYENFFEMLNNYNPNLLGGKIPDSEFYR